MQKESLKLRLVGISHKTSSVEMREKFQISRDKLSACLSFFRNVKDMREVIVVPTCNRLEFYMVLPEAIDPRSIVYKYYDSVGISDDINDELFYEMSDFDAVRHIFRVVAGMESLVMGEYQIQGQVKEAYSIACGLKTVDNILHKLFHAAFRTGKKVRSETPVGAGKQSVSGVASEIVIENSDPNDIITIIGVNENTKILAEKLKQKGYKNLIFVNRTLYKAEICAHDYGGKAVDITKIEEAAAKADVLFSCTGAPGFVVDAPMLNRIIESKDYPRMIVDMAIPRDIETDQVKDIINTYDIGDLQKYLDGKMSKRNKAVPLAEKFIEDEVQIYRAWSDTRHNNILQPYAEQFEMIRQQVSDEYLINFPEQSSENLEKLTRSLVHRLQSVFIKAVVKERKGQKPKAV